jgi:hypothetical protein
MRKNGVSDGGPTAKTAKSNNPEAAPTVATTLAIITLAGEASYAPQPIQSLVFEAEPITAEAYTDVFGTTPAFEASYVLAMDPGIAEVTFSRILINATRAKSARHVRPVPLVQL